MALAALLLLPLAVSMRAGVRLLRCSASSRGPASRAHVGLPKGVEWGRQYHRPASGAASGLPPQDRPFTVLGIETSCDDTGVAVVRSDGTILGEALADADDAEDVKAEVIRLILEREAPRDDAKMAELDGSKKEEKK